MTFGLSQQELRQGEVGELAAGLRSRVHGPEWKAPLSVLEPQAMERLSKLDKTRWGRHRYAPPDEATPPLPHATEPTRILEYLTSVQARGPGQALLARVLLRGLGVGYGVADLHNEERRLGVHHLPPIVRRFEAALLDARKVLAFGTAFADVPSLPMGRPAFRRLGKRAITSPLEPSPSLVEHIAHAWALYATYLSLKQEAETLTGAPEDESFQGLRRPEGTEHEAFKAHLWYELADVVFLGIQEGLLRVTVAEWHSELVKASFEPQKLYRLVQNAVLARVTGEGRAWQRLRSLVEALTTEPGADAFFTLVDQALRCVESGFRQSTSLQSDAWTGLDPAEKATVAHLKVRALSTSAQASHAELLTVMRSARQSQLLLAETWLEDVYGQRLQRRARHAAQNAQQARADKAQPNGQAAWKALVQAQQSLLEWLEAHANEADAPELALSEQLLASVKTLRRAQEQAADAMRLEPEFLHWPGDGEDYRTRRQRATASADRFSYLLAMGERLLLAVELGWLKQEARLGLSRESCPAPSGASIKQLMETHESCLFVEEWVAHFGPRLEVVWGLATPEYKLPGNRRTFSVDKRVRELVGLARTQGGAPETWAWIFCGITDRLRELIRREGADGETSQRVETLLLSGRVQEAEAEILTRAAPEAEASDFDAYVTVGVHIFNADTRIVRENLLHNRQLFWPEENLWLLVGSSSANRGIAEREREICLETGTTHRFVAARRHQKAGNQNRVIPNVPSHPQGKTFYLTLDDDYLSGSQTLTRLVSVAERHPTAAFVQLPLYLFGNHLLGVSRARLADASGMVVWGSLTSLGLRDLRIFPDKFANRRTLALPFGTCTLFRLSPEANSLDGTGGMFTDTVCEDFAQGLLAFSLKHVHHPRPPTAHWDDGILLNEVWIEGDGVELFGRIRQQTRWCEGSVRNGWTIWIPAVVHHLRQRFGLENLPDSRPPSLPQLFGGSVMVLGYGLELLGMVLFMVGFPLTSVIAEYSNTLGHTLKFWMGLWGLHLAYSYYLALNCGLSLKTFLDQHFIRFASVMGLLEGMYKSLRSPTNTWSACKDARVQINVRIGAVYAGVALLNIAGAVVGALKGMTIYYLCLISAGTALWQFQLRDASPIGILDRVRHLPSRLKTPVLAWWAFSREGRRPEHAQDLSRPIPFVMPITGVLMALTILAMSARYWELLPKLPGLSHHHPIFLAWLLSSDAAQILSMAWVWLFILCGVRNQPLFHFSALMQAGRRSEVADYRVDQARAHAEKLRPVGRLITYLGGWREKFTRTGFFSASGAWVMVGVLALALRLPHLDMNSAFMDESYYIDAGRRFLTEGVNVGIAKVMFGSYLYPIMTALASYAGGLWGARLLSHFAGVITALAVGQVGHRLGGHRVGVIAAVASAIAYQSIYISALATYDAVSVAGVAVSLAFFATALWGRGAERLAEHRKLALLLASGMALLFGILTKYVGVIFFPGMLVGVGFFSVLEQLWKPMVGAQAAPASDANASTDYPSEAIKPGVGGNRAVAVKPAATVGVFDALISPTVRNRLLAFGAPLILGGGLYGLTQVEVLKEWWAFSKEYKTLITSDWQTLREIYLVKGWNILLAMGLAVVGWKVSFPSATPTQRLRDTLSWTRIFMAAQVGMFFLFHFATRADVNYLKHVNYILPFLLPMAAMGLWRFGDIIREWLDDHGLPRFATRWLSLVALCIPLLLLGLREVDVLGGALHWWPDLRPYAAAMETGLRSSDRVLVDDTGLIYYTLDRKVAVDSPFFASVNGLTGTDAVKAGIQQRLYDVVIFDGGITPEGRAMHEAVAPLLYPAGYRRVFVRPDSPDMAGFYVAPHALDRFKNAQAVGEAWMEKWYKENKKAE